jgi:hypothetical protein
MADPCELFPIRYEWVGDEQFERDRARRSMLSLQNVDLYRNIRGASWAERRH